MSGIKYIIYCFCLWSIFCLHPAKANEKKTMLNKDNTVADILSRPEFQGFAHNLLPWDNSRQNAPDVKIRQIQQLLPYHNNIVTSDVLEPLNYMLKTINSGKNVFYNIYPEQDSRQSNTGIFFFRGNPNAPFAIICPGGGFSYVGSFHEGFPIALALSKRGYNAFVIKYRAGSADWAMQDLAQAITYIFDNAEMLGVSTQNYSVWGGSAGARMAAYIGSYGVQVFGGKELPYPNAVIMGYTGHSDFSKKEPATFMYVGENDWIANPRRMKQQADRLNNLGIKTEFHSYPNLGHGFGLGTNTAAEGWLDKAVKFWKKQILVSTKEHQKI